jgi:hypothetical protein
MICLWCQRYHYCSKHGKVCGNDLWDHFEQLQGDFSDGIHFSNVIISLTEEVTIINVTNIDKIHTLHISKQHENVYDNYIISISPFNHGYGRKNRAYSCSKLIRHVCCPNRVQFINGMKKFMDHSMPKKCHYL